MTVGGGHALIFMLGRPVAQTKSPALMNAWFERQGIACALVPLALSDAGQCSALDLVRQGSNVKGAIVTLPFKGAVGRHLDELSDVSQALGAVNAVRKGADGRLQGDMLDGKAMVRALQVRGIELRGRRAFLAGCGGAGSAMAYSACAAGVRALRLMDTDTARAARLAAVLAARFRDCDIGLAQSPGPSDLLLNATPLGMQPGDPLPIALSQAAAGCVAVDAVTSTGVTPWVAACRARGLAAIDGNELAAAQQPLLLDFFGFG